MVPGGGPSLDGKRFVASKHPHQPRRRKPFLTDYGKLGREFRSHFIRGLRRLIRGGKLRLDGEFAELLDKGQRERWLEKLKSIDWGVYIEGPPHGQSRPEHVIKYLARYISGGPIANSRLVSDDGNHVTFMARSHDKARGNPPEPFVLKPTEFVRRWAMHILPKGFTRSRSYGGYHGGKRGAYLAQCRAALNLAACDDTTEPPPEAFEAIQPKCPHCEAAMECIMSSPRPSWRDVFATRIYANKSTYSPRLHLQTTGLRPAHPLAGYDYSHATRN